jgi:hypothetical protein
MSAKKHGADTRFVAWQSGMELVVSVCERYSRCTVKIVDGVPARKGEQKAHAEMSFEFSLNDAEEMAEFLNREIKSRRGQALTKYEELKEKLQDDADE